ELEQDRARRPRVHLAADQESQDELDAARALEIAHHEAVAATAPALDDSAVFELADRLAQCRPADAEALAQVPFGPQPLAGRAAAEDLGSDAARDQRRQRAIAILP